MRLERTKCSVVSSLQCCAHKVCNGSVPGLRDRVRFLGWCPAMLELDGRLRPIEDIEMELEARLVTRTGGCLMLLDLA